MWKTKTKTNEQRMKIDNWKTVCKTNLHGASMWEHTHRMPMKSELMLSIQRYSKFPKLRRWRNWSSKKHELGYKNP